MRFVHPEILYALFALIIPIIVHLFQLRRFKTEAFTNVVLLKKLETSSRKSSQLKKWLTLITRLLLVGSLIMAFAQPYFPNQVASNDEKELSIFLDNSYSMSLKGENGELFLRAKEDLIEYLPENEKFHLATHTDNYKDLTKKELKSIIFDISYTSNTLDFKNLITKSISNFNKKTKTKRNLIVLSDFQSFENSFQADSTDAIDYHLVKYKPINTQNFSIDTLYLKKDSNSKQLIFKIKSSTVSNATLPVSIFNFNKLLGKFSLKFDDESEKIYQFDIDDTEIKGGKIIIEDSGLRYDNSLYFSITKPEPINVLVISNTYTEYFDRIFKNERFNYKQVLIENLEYSEMTSNDVILLNELSEIPETLSLSVENAKKDNKVIGIIPGKNANVFSYNILFKALNFKAYQAKINREIKLTNINFGHPLFTNVFTEKVENFDYPTFESYFSSNTSNSALDFSNGGAFLELNGKSFRFNAPIENNSNFKQSPLIVLSFYNLALQAQSSEKLYYNIGQPNSISVKSILKSDEVLKIERDNEIYIPRQEFSGEYVSLTLADFPKTAGHYVITNADKDTLQHLAFNYNTKESKLAYVDVDDKQSNVYNNFKDFSEYFDNSYKIKSFWQWFIAFALMFMIIELFLLKYIK
jgi:hypothetical protein